MKNIIAVASVLFFLNPSSAFSANNNVPGALDRSQFDTQLKDPTLMAKFAGRVSSEVGGQGTAAQVAFAESVMNRAASRNQPLLSNLTGSYYPPSPKLKPSNNPAFIAAITKAWKEGTDTTTGATGNASGTVDFGGGKGHYNAQHKWVSPNQTIEISGERFGYEQYDLDHGWMAKYKSLKRP